MLEELLNQAPAIHATMMVLGQLATTTLVDY